MKKALLMLLFLAMPALAFSQTTDANKPVKTITDADIPPGASVLFSADTVYVLDGMVFVDTLATLTIEAGTVVKAEDGVNFDASGLVVTRGAQIFAEGTADEPIIFTSVNDDLTDPDDMFDVTGSGALVPVRGSWGGVVILGNATTNNPTPGGEKRVEGVNQIVPDSDTRATYGGTDDDDDSGIFRYVSIRHTGINVGDAQSGNEIQGLTLGAVGRGTTIEYVESYASNDDGFEWFGGTVNTKYLVSAFNADDSFDWDEGFRGKGQFWFAIQGTDAAGAAAEQDGATNDEFYTPFATPTLYNLTYIGPGSDAPDNLGDRDELIIFRDNAGGILYKSVFMASPEAAIEVEADDTKQEDSQSRLEAGELVIASNQWWDFGAGNTLAEFAPQDFVQTHLAANDNRIGDPLLRSISRDAEGMLDPRPGEGSPVFDNVPNNEDDDAFFTEADYLGAFGGTNWLGGWTALDNLGYVDPNSLVSVEEIDGEIPTQIGLDQNYPNPFNPTTTIEFTLDQAQDVRLAVYDLLGREVAVLADGPMAARAYRVTFDATDLASGLYLYRLQTEKRTVARTMTLLK